MERLLSLEVLDLRSNLIDDVSELTRLVTLPHLKAIYVSDGNPFAEDPSTAKRSTSNGWRIDLFNALLMEASSERGGRTKENLPSIDGAPPTWNEKRYLVEQSHGSYAIDQVSEANGHARSGSARFQDRSAAITIPRRSRQSLEASSRATGMASKTSHTPQGLPSDSSPTIDVDERNGDKVEKQPLIVKRKHRRVVDLDGHGLASSTRKHERSVSSPNAINGSKVEQGSDLPLEDGDAVSYRHATIPSHPSSISKSRHNLRNITDSTFTPGAKTNHHTSQSKNGNDQGEGGVASGSGSEVDEFRRKMEKLRDEVGVENWLSVYASASQANGSSDESLQKQLQASKKR